MRKRWVQVTLGVFVVLLAASYLLRDVIATKVGALVLEGSSPKLHCTRPKVSLSATLTRIEFDAVECTMAEGPVRYARVEGTSTIALHLFGQSQLHIPKVKVDMRDRDVSHVEPDTMSELASVTGLMDMLYKGIMDFSEMYSPDAPPVTIEELTMLRAGKQEALLHEFRKSSDGEWDRCQAADVKASGVAKLVTLRSLDLRVKPDEGQLQLAIYMSKPDKGENPDMSVAIRAEALDEKRPRFAIQM
jgi:hypothetical protein